MPFSTTRRAGRPSANRFIGLMTYFLWVPVCIKNTDEKSIRVMYARQQLQMSLFGRICTQTLRQHVVKRHGHQLPLITKPCEIVLIFLPVDRTGAKQ